MLFFNFSSVYRLPILFLVVVRLWPSAFTKFLRVLLRHSQSVKIETARRTAPALRARKSTTTTKPATTTRGRATARTKSTASPLRVYSPKAKTKFKKAKSTSKEDESRRPTSARKKLTGSPAVKAKKKSAPAPKNASPGSPGTTNDTSSWIQQLKMHYADVDAYEVRRFDSKRKKKN